MKAHLNVAGGALTFELSGETTKDLFEQISAVQEVFEAEKYCGCCQGTDLRFLARQVDDFKFYEIACQNHACRARFAFGQAKKGGGLFPKRKDEDGEWLPNHGWAKFTPKTEAVGNGHANGASRPAAQKTAGVPTFASWEDAERHPEFGWLWVNIAGKMFKSVDGNYIQQAKQ